MRLDSKRLAFGVVALLFALCLLTAVRVRSSCNSAEMKYAQLKPGMTWGEVHAVMGQDPCFAEGGLVRMNCCWELGLGYAIVVRFHEDQLEEKHIYRPESVWEGIRSWFLM